MDEESKKTKLNKLYKHDIIEDVNGPGQYMVLTKININIRKCAGMMRINHARKVPYTNCE